MKALLSTTVLFLGLVSGLLYGYSCSVNPGLKALSNYEYLKSMQSINHVIQNPVFFMTFMGLLILFPLTNYQLYQQKNASFGMFTWAMVIYLVGVFGVTVLCNVPLNDQLAKFSIQTATENDLTQMRKIFERPWNLFHGIRTLASIASFGMAILAILKQKI